MQQITLFYLILLVNFFQRWYDTYKITITVNVIKINVDYNLNKQINLKFDNPRLACIPPLVSPTFT